MCIRDRVSEFLVMAATLLDIKARMLLPREVSEEGEEEDPRAELVERLLEYKTYKYISLELKDMEAVSYTHLDVYKRQTLVLVWIKTGSGPGTARWAAMEKEEAQSSAPMERLYMERI